MAVRRIVKKTSTTKNGSSKRTITRTATAKTRTIKKSSAKATKTVTKSGAIVRKENAVSATGNKKIGTLQKEFNRAFPYLQLCVFYSYARQQVAKGERISQIDANKTLASVRRENSGGDISISGVKRVGSLESEFDKVFGLYVQICYTAKDGHGYYTTGSSDSMTLAAFNKKCEADGCKKGVWR